MEKYKDSEENNKYKLNMNDIIPPFFKNMEDKALLEFDYEINKVKLDTEENLNSKMYIVDRLNPKEMRIVNYNEYKDKLFDLNEEKEKKSKKTFKAFCLKRLVSKKKRRYEDEEFDLDMTYVTKRVVAMGFPSTGCETIYRNSLKDISDLFKKKHNNNVKVYNLCVEKDRIYTKDLFPLSSVTLFPSKDHNPCPIKLILEFCVDLVLHLINNPYSIGAVHCKAGKGRTGVMISAYLVFSGLCSTADEAFDYYAKVRTHNHKGVTIPSQRRYVKYFESFLQTNFCKPYVHMIPQIIKYHIQDKTKNILRNFMHDERYFVSPNEFSLNFIKIGPLPKKLDFSISICNFVYKPLKFKLKKQSECDDGKAYYFVFIFEDKVKIDSDIKIKISKGFEFYVWVNLWYSTLEIIRQFVNQHHTEKESEENKKIRFKEEIEKNENGKVRLLGSEIEMSNIIEKYDNNEMDNDKIVNNPFNKNDTEQFNSFNNNNRTTPQMNNNNDINFRGSFNYNSNNINIKKEVSPFSYSTNNEHNKNNIDNYMDANYITISNIENVVNSNVDNNNYSKSKKLSIISANKNFDNYDNRDKSDRSMIEREDSNLNHQSNGFVRKIDILEDSEPDVFQIIDSLNHSTNLNRIIKAVNKINKKKSRPLINTEDFSIKLNAFELDKFCDKKKMLQDFNMVINYSIHQTQN